MDGPDHTIDGIIHGQPAKQILYTYLFRPNYRVRQDVQRRFDKFDIEKDTCTIMHVRRGDSGRVLYIITFFKLKTYYIEIFLDSMFFIDYCHTFLLELSLIDRMFYISNAPYSNAP